MAYSWTKVQRMMCDVGQNQEFIDLHVFTKNLQSVRGSERFEDFIAEIDNVEFDIGIFTETWRDEREELVATPGGHRLFLAGGSDHSGVGICLSKSLLPKISEMTFHAISDRVCFLNFRCGHIFFTVFFFSCYFPTAWVLTDEVVQVHETLHLLLANVKLPGGTPLLGGDFK